MQKKKSPDRSYGEKLIRLFAKLMFTGQKYSLTDLARTLGCSKQTVLRLVDEITLVYDVPLRDELRAGRKWVWIDRSGAQAAGAEVQVLIPAVCAAFVGGCPGIQAAVRNVAPDTTCAATTMGDCECTARQAGGLNDADGYTTEGGQIVSATLMRRWDYCIDGDALRYRDVSAREPREPGVITLRRAAR